MKKTILIALIGSYLIVFCHLFGTVAYFVGYETVDKFINLQNMNRLLSIANLIGELTIAIFFYVLLSREK